MNTVGSLVEAIGDRCSGGFVEKPEDLEAGQIDAQAPLFREGLGLDSIDALELSLAIKQKYGVQLKAEDENVTEIFASLAALTAHVQANV